MDLILTPLNPHKQHIWKYIYSKYIYTSQAFAIYDLFLQILTKSSILNQLD